MRHRAFAQVDVFTAVPFRGNPVAVVLDATGLGDEAMARFARWTNLSETTFVLPPTDPAADYRLRIFTPGGELPFAGHPTLGSAHAWLEAGGTPRVPGTLVQECGIGLVHLRAVLQSVGALVLSEQIAVGGAASAFTPEGRLADERLQQMLDRTATRLVDVAGRLRP